MKTIRTFKMTHRTHLFNLNQRMFVVFRVSGAAYVCGKYRGKGRYIYAWVAFPENAPFPDIREIEVEDTNPLLRRIYSAI